MTGLVLPHDVVGTGNTRVLAIHGWLGDRTSFDPIRPYLDTERFSYAFVDLRGYGEAMGIGGSHTVDEAAADVLATAGALGWDTFGLIGHSMGGMIAQHVLDAALDRVRAIAGISPVPASGARFEEDGWMLFSGAAGEPANRRAIIDMTTGHRLPARWLDAMVERSMRRSDPAVVRRILDSWSGADISDRVRGAELPVLVIAGERDGGLPPDAMRDTWMRWYPNAELEVFADAGHYAPDEVPLALVARLEGFLAV